MSEGNWGEKFSTGLIVNAAIIGFGFAVMVTIYGWSQKSQYELEATRAHQEYLSNSYYPQRDACFAVPAIHQKDCLAKHRADSRENERREQDLVAQKVTALWTVLMGCAAIFGMILSFIGVFLVWSTFRAAREANKFAKVSSDAAVQSAQFVEESFRRVERPYLHIRVLETFRLGLPETEMASIRYTFNNYGKSPAIIKSYNVRLQSLPKLPLRLPMLNNRNWYEVVEPSKELNNRLFAVVENALPGQAFHRMTDIVLHGAIQYDDQMGALHTDHFCLRGSANGFVLEGGAEYNYRQTSYPNAES
jgi:hypothetical protein